jgi:radical SAM-linked protein
MAAGLPMGVTSEGELLDAITAAVVEPAALAGRLEPDLPEGLTVLGVSEVGIGLPSLPSAVRWADYDVDVESNCDGLTKAVADLLAADELPWVDRRGEKTRRYDLRPLVGDVMVVESSPPTVRLTMRLRCGPDGVGRADQVAKALGLSEPIRVHRRRLLLADESRARAAWRRKGRYL